MNMNRMRWPLVIQKVTLQTRHRSDIPPRLLFHAREWTPNRCLFWSEHSACFSLAFFVLHPPTKLFSSLGSLLPPPIDCIKHGRSLRDVTRLLLQLRFEAKRRARPYWKWDEWRVPKLTAIGRPSVTWSELWLWLGKLSILISSKRPS